MQVLLHPVQVVLVLCFQQLLPPAAAEAVLYRELMLVMVVLAEELVILFGLQDWEIRQPQFHHKEITAV